MSEIERRWIVTSMDPDALRGTPTHIKQGYFVTPADLSMSVRVADDTTAWLRPKFGTGIERDDSNEHEISLQTAKCLYHGTPDILYKRRYVRDGWELDVYEQELSGLVVLEREFPSKFTEFELPPWIHSAKEVTNSITNQHLARLATELKGVEIERPVFDYLHRRLPVIVLTGGPCSGKSTIMEWLRRNDNSTHFVPEVATILISQVGVHPPAHDPVEMMRFNRTVYRVQRAFEELSNGHAVRASKRALVVDRGTVDAVPYMPNGLQDFTRMTQGTIDQEYAYYDLVLYLETPSAKVYQANAANNSARSETYEQAVALSEKTKNAWSGHPKFQVIPAESEWEKKAQLVQSLIGYELDRNVY